MTVTKDTLIIDVLREDIETAQYFFEIGMYCVGCPSSRGESIAESLVSILVVAIASILFAGMVMASSRVIEKSTKWMNEYYEAVSFINQQQKLEGRVDSISVKISIDGNETNEIVTAFINDDMGVTIVSYNKDDGSTP